MRDQPIEIFPSVTIVTFVSSLYNYLPLLTMGWLNSKKKKGNGFHLIDYFQNS